MAVVWARQIRSRQWRGEFNKLTGQRLYRVLCNAKTDDPDIAASACPAPYSAWSVAVPGLLVASVDAREANEAPATGGALYDVTLDYQSVSIEPSQRVANPLERPAIARLSFDGFEETIYQQRFAAPIAVDSDDTTISIGTWHWGKSICNSAGKPFDPSITECFRDPIITVTKNISLLPWGISQLLVNTINAEDQTVTYRGNSYVIPEECGWLYDLNSEPRYENGVEYEEVQAVIKVRKDGWLRKIRDEGLYELNDGDTPAKPIRDAAGLPVQQPTLLDGKGAKLANGGSPVWLKFLTRHKSVWDGLADIFN